MVPRTRLRPGEGGERPPLWRGRVWAPSYISRSSREAIWHLIVTLCNHLWGPKGNLRVFFCTCVVGSNPQEEGYEQISLAEKVGPCEVMNPVVKLTQGNKRCLKQVNSFPFDSRHWSTLSSLSWDQAQDAAGLGLILTLDSIIERGGEGGAALGQQGRRAPLLPAPMQSQWGSSSYPFKVS